MADFGAGRELMAHVVHAVDRLKSREAPVLFDDIWSYLSLAHDQQRHKSNLHKALSTHPKVEFLPKGGPNGQGAFKFRPPHPVSSGEELKGYLQQQTTAQGIPVSELKEGWSGAVATIDTMEAAGELLVTRHKKDNAPKMVWNTDSSLSHQVDDDFKIFWHKRAKAPDELRMELERAGLTPTSQIKEVATMAGPQQKKRRIQRKIGKTTNTHMLGILKDYSAMKR